MASDVMTREEHMVRHIKLNTNQTGSSTPIVEFQW